MLIHDHLRLAREQTGLSQAKMAALTGLSRNQIVRAAQIAVSLGAVEAMREHLYRGDSGPDPLKTQEIRPDEDPPKEG